MDSDASASSPQRASAAAFWWRLTDNAFRRWYFFVLPIIIFAGIGVFQSTKTLEIYRSSGTLSATVNPLLPDQAIGGIDAQFWETPGDVASRTMNEQLRTDAFIEEIAESAGLTDAVQSGALQLEVIRQSVWSTADGTALVKVNATWADAETSMALVEGAIAGYQEYLAETVASDASEAEAFYNDQLETHSVDVERARTALTDFIEDLPELESDESLGFVDQIRIDELRGDLTVAEGKVTAAEEEIEKAALNVAQSKSEAGRSLTVIDPPSLPGSPESTLIDRIVTIMSYTLLGIATVVAALLVSTVLDHSVSSARDLTGLESVTFVATVPVWHQVTTRHAEPSKRRGKSARRAPDDTSSSSVSEEVRAGV